MSDRLEVRILILAVALAISFGIGAIAKPHLGSDRTPRFVRVLLSIAIALMGAVAAVTLMGACGFSVSGGTSIDAGDTDASVVTPDADEAALPDASIDQAPFDTLPPLRIISQTASRDITPNIGTICNAPGGQSTRDGTWLRVFTMSGGFDVEAIGVGIASSSEAMGIVVKIGTYSVAPAGDELDPDAITWRASATFDAGTASDPRFVEVPLAYHATASERMIVAVAAPSLQSVGGVYRQGVTASMETAPGYFASVACAKDPPATLESLGATGHVVLEVIGRDMP